MTSYSVDIDSVITCYRIRIHDQSGQLIGENKSCIADISSGFTPLQYQKAEPDSSAIVHAIMLAGKSAHNLSPQTEEL